MLRPLLLVAACSPVDFAVAQEPVELTSHLDAVTVYPSSARVLRITEPLAAGGRYVLRGLPATLEPASVRVRCRDGYVVGVEVRERIEDRTPEARVQELRDRIAELRGRLAALRDDLGITERKRTHLRLLLGQAGRAEQVEVSGGEVSLDEWARRHEFVTTRLRENAKAARELRWSIEEEESRLQAIEWEVGRLTGGSVSLRDVHVKTVTSKADARLEVEYLVQGASWRPRYDVRAREDGQEVRLVYRGEVHQETGEDWTEVRLLLSSAEPKRSARGPELEGRWAWLYDPRAKGLARAPAAAADLVEAERSIEATKELGYAGDEEDQDAPPFAAVQDEGLSVRFAVPGRDTVETAGGSTAVLIGETDLAVRPEYYCVPALDTAVWLRGHARNDSEWPILAGAASVFFGEDFLGDARLETAERGSEFSVPLGAADAITCERVLTTDRSKGPSLFGSKRKDVEGWRLTFSNNGGSVCESDGSVTVVVREAIPKPTDKSIAVELTGLSHSTAPGEKWRKEAEELGIETWILRIPPHRQVDLRFQVATSYPRDEQVIYR